MVFFHFHSNFIGRSVSKLVENLIRRRGSAASELVLHRLPMSHKKDARLI